MKTWIILALLFHIQLRCYAQDFKYADIHDYIHAHCKPPNSVLSQCGWQLAMVKLITNKTGHVIGYSFLNDVSDSLKLVFKPLLQYRFPSKLNMKNKSFVFAQTYYNLQGKCTRNDLPDVQNVFNITYQCFIKQLQLDRATIFDDIIFTTMSDDNVIIDKRP